MKSAKLSFDFSDQPEIVTQLRLHAARYQMSLKLVLAQALEAYFAHGKENELLLQAASQTFSEWDSPEDQIYETF
jgi:hypothetical protein